MPRVDVALLVAAVLLIAVVAIRQWRSGSANVVDGTELGLAELVTQLREDITSLQQSEQERAKQNPGTRALLVVGTSEVEVSFVIKRSADGKVKAVPVEAGVTYSQEQVQRVRLQLLPNTQPREGVVPPEP